MSGRRNLPGTDKVRFKWARPDAGGGPTAPLEQQTHAPIGKPAGRAPSNPTARANVTKHNNTRRVWTRNPVATTCPSEVQQCSVAISSALQSHLEPPKTDEVAPAVVPAVIGRVSTHQGPDVSTSGASGSSVGPKSDSAQLPNRGPDDSSSTLTFSPPFKATKARPSQGVSAPKRYKASPSKVWKRQTEATTSPSQQRPNSQPVPVTKACGPTALTGAARSSSLPQGELNCHANRHP